MKKMRRKTIILLLSVVITATLLTGCLKVAHKPTPKNFKMPEVTLSYVDVAHYWGWWYYKKTVKPTMGTAGDYGAPLDLAFIFDVTNPNSFPVLLEDLKFTVAFEEFDLNTPNYVHPQWIPAGKTNQVRVHAMFDGRQSLLSLLVAGGFQLKEKTGAAGAGPALKQLGKWWEGIPEFAFPIYVKGGSAVFKADGLVNVATFSGQFPE
jgi:LEA14-like dessication related protein